MYVGWPIVGYQKLCSTLNGTPWKKKPWWAKTAPLRCTQVDMKKTGIPHDSWEKVVLQKCRWQRLLKKAMTAIGDQRHLDYQSAHA